MRKLVLLFLIFVPNILSGQINFPAKVFLNSQLISLDSVFINPQKVESINVKKDSDGGQVIIKTKDLVWKYKTIDELIKTTSFYSQIVLDTSITPIFYIDGKLIVKKSDAKIDSSYFAYVTLKKLSEIESLKKPCKKIVLVQIILTNTEPKPEIVIRGNTIEEIEDYYKIKK